MSGCELKSRPINYKYLPSPGTLVGQPGVVIKQDRDTTVNRLTDLAD